MNSAELVKYRREIIEKYADVTSIRIAGECIKRKIPFDTDLLQQYTFQVMAIVVHKVRRTGNPHPISVTDLIEQTIKQFLDLLATLQRK